ncbi:MAG TPA: RNase adapter RapZ [Peptococcaceae bacterium]|nr:RNase adapter RapZ [Peptococcaceae bacterium]
MRLVIVTGLSGAGKSQAIRCLEDLGFFCVDNLPPSLIPKITELCQQSNGKIKRVALVMDVRGALFFDSLGGLSEELGKLRQQGIQYEILFLEASDAVLVRRYKESRRQHPLEEDGSVLEAIRTERKRLQELRGSANVIMDTTDMTVHDLKKSLISIYQNRENGENGNYFSITILSFGYKYGIPLDADLVMDVRFLPNPHYVDELKYLTGLDSQVNEYLFSYEETGNFLNRYCDLLNYLLPYYIKEGKTHLVVAIGCTGGQHRSVALTERMAAELSGDYKVQVHHRDLHRAKVEGEP